MDTDLSLAEHNMPGMSQPLAPFLATVGAFKREVGLPVFHAARIPDIATARHAIAEGLLDMVAMTRAHMADPQIVNKLMRGEEERIRPCVGASYCMYKKLACIHNPATGREQSCRRSCSRRRARPQGRGRGRRARPGWRRRGSPPERGHKVVLFEAASQAGRPAAAGGPRDLAARPYRHRRLAHRRAGAAGRRRPPQHLRHGRRRAGAKSPTR